MNRLPAWLRFVTPLQWTGTVALLIAMLLPWEALLDAAAARFNTVRDFHDHYAGGVVWLRLALAANGLLALAWPRLRRALLEPWPPPGGPRPHDRADLAIGAGLFLLALGVRLVGITRSLQHDEWYTAVEWIRHGPLVIATRYTGLTNHVLYSLLAWGGVKLCGLNEVGLRLPALLFGSAAPVALYGALRGSMDRRAALLGGLVLALSSLAVSYGQEARSYSMALFGVSALFWVYRELRVRPSASAFRWAVAVSVFLVYARLYNVAVLCGFLAAAVTTGFLGAREERPLVRRAALAFGAAGFLSLLLYSPNLATVLAVQGGARHEGGEPGEAYAHPFVLVPGDFSVAYLPSWVMSAAWALTALGLVPLWLRDRDWGLILAGVGAFTLWSAGLDVNNSRFYIQLLPPIAMAQAAGISWLGGRGRAGGIAAWTLVAGLALAHACSLGVYHSRGKLDFKGAAEFLSAQPGTDRVGLAHDSKTVAFYIRDPQRCIPVGAKSVDREAPGWIVVHTVTLGGEGAFAARVYAGYEQAWVRPAVWGYSLTVWRRKSTP